jgi:hypothetical protein
MRSVACVLPIALGIGAAFFSPLWRNLFRTFFLIPALLLGPLSFGSSCFLLSYEASTDPSNSALAQVMVLVADGMLSFCVLSIVALWLFPATRNLGDPERSHSGKARVVLAVFLWLAVLASALQAFTVPYSITHGGLTNGTTTLAVQSFLFGFTDPSLQPAAKFGLIMVSLTGLVGLVSGILLVTTNLQVYVAKDQATPKSLAGCVPLLAGSVSMLSAAVSCLILFAGIFWTTHGSGTLDLRLALAKADVIGSAVGTEIGMSLAWLAIVVPTTYLAAFGIGALRPLGRFSEWLLLPFFPFFFISIVSLWSPFYLAIFRFHLFANPVALLYPFLVSVPFLVYLTFFFKGQTNRWRNADPHPSFFQAVVLPSWPVTVTFALVSALFAARDSFWSFLVPNGFKTPGALLMSATETFDLSFFRIVILTLSVGTLLVFFPILAYLQVSVVDRLRIRVG